MAKKSRKRSRSQPPVRQFDAPAAQPAAARNRPPRAEPAQVAPARTTADIAGEYRYVIGDLRRIGVLAAAMFALLVVAALVAQFVIR